MERVRSQVTALGELKIIFICQMKSILVPPNKKKINSLSLSYLGRKCRGQLKYTNLCVYLYTSYYLSKVRF